MRRFFAFFVAMAIMGSACFADRSLLLVTPNGVWKSEVTASGPGPWVAQSNIDVIVQGFGPGNVPNPPPNDPPASDPVTLKLAEISRYELKDKSQGTACAALVSSLVKVGITADKLKQAIELAAPILDAQIKADGRITNWAKAITAVSTDPKKIADSLVLAWDVELSTIDRVTAAAILDRSQPIPAEALDWALLIQVIQMIIELLKSLGVI